MPQTPRDLAQGIPFSFFCSLLREISRAPTHKANFGHRYNTPSYPALNILQRWVDKLRKDYSPLPPGTTAIIFKLLFPDEDHCRKFDMQESRLSQHIANCFAIDSGSLQRWLSDNASGCLGEELRLVLEKTCPSLDGHISPLYIDEVDKLLDELASNSGYSDISIRKKYPKTKRRSRQTVIRELFRTLSPLDSAFLSQIILKDLRPILYPLRDTHYIASLLGHNSASTKMLSKDDAMKCDLTETARRFELPLEERGPNIPGIGIPVAIPKSEKGRGPRHALEYFCQSQQIWAETKYDGERAQIHVEILSHRANITIFSKSKRNSTWDRKAVHENIYHALGISMDGMLNRESRFCKNVILDAEMVAFHGERIDEFWRIRSLIEQTASGIRAKRRNVPAEFEADSELFSQSSMRTDYIETRRLGLVFFDVLFLDSNSLLMTPYSQRRQILEDLIHHVPGICILAERFPLTCNGVDRGEQRLITLEKAFARTIANCQEGLVLKGEETKYHDFSTPWVKLKRDYIPGYGDTLDMVILGVGWDRERARVLRVPPSTITTFYIGALENAQQLKRQPSCQPHFQMYFTVSYGLNRQQLEEINFILRSSDVLPYNPSFNSDELQYTFTILPGLPPPRSILKTPLLAELFGAGFDKSPQSRHYELRFPRLNKVYRPNERGWREGINLQDLHRIACEVIGRDSSSKEAKDISAEIWGKVASPGAKSLSKRKAISDLWEERFAFIDGRPRVRTRAESPTPSPTELAERTLIALNHDNDVLPEMPHLSTTSSSRKQIQSMPSPPSSPEASTAVLDDAFITQPALTETYRRRKPVSEQGRFLDNALVWFAKPHGRSWQLNNPIPRQKRLHSLESLLTGCGWYLGVSRSAWAKRGIIIVDESDVVGKEMSLQLLNTLKERQHTLPPEQLRSTIWIIDRRHWTMDAEDIESLALSKFN
ncbi:hypothetical protein H0H81_001062 [Sphagnurus paluster]|uniref:ATP-dependent DNA ligase family profile domain-containing protein n=1 Tax=Sphagnurus paluster TaxID=117069 RepID=A0A9P7GUS7_9AGAR|nr:hypothetical protein H0H81_001062 [Sphagnurus paluster]